MAAATGTQTCSGDHVENHSLVLDLLQTEVNLGEWSMQMLQDELFVLSDLANYYTDEMGMLNLLKLVRDTLFHFGDAFARGDASLHTLTIVVRCLFSDVLSAFRVEEFVLFGHSGEYGNCCPVLGAMNTLLFQMQEYLAEMQYLSQFDDQVVNMFQFVKQVVNQRQQKMIEVLQCESL